MGQTQPTEGRDISSRLTEAEAYHSMGLLTEALDVYRSLLDQLPKDQKENRVDVRDKIASLEQELEAVDSFVEDGLSKKDISIIKDTLADKENTASILDTASAFKELGLYNDAVATYIKLLFVDYPMEKVATEIVECLFAFRSPSKSSKHMHKIVSDRRLDKQKKAQLTLLFGKEAEKRSENEVALDFYKSAKELDPKNTEITKMIDSVLGTLSSDSKYDYLLKKNMVSTEQLQQALPQAKKRKVSVEYILTTVFKIKKSDVGKSLSFFYGRPFKEYDPDLSTPVELLGKLKKPFLLQEHWVPLSWGKEGIEVLIDDPKDLNKTDNIRALLKTKKINFSVAFKEDIDAYINRFFDPGSEGAQDEEPNPEVVEDFDMLPDIQFEEEEEEDAEDTAEFNEASGKVVKLVDQCLITAFRKNASDIHIEPSQIKKATTIRFRIDGICQDYVTIPNSLAKGVISRVKIMSGLDIAEKRLPQDGKIKFKRKGVPPFELRVATLPTAGNYEDAVLRILTASRAMKLEELDLSEKNETIMRSILKKPYGIILAVGPTGSGKTTTLHSSLAHINTPGIKIWTAEDPVEITQAGLRQVEVKPKIGLNFARIMRSFLRADPDIIMIGEMRDEETASIAIEASLTGHLVFSTLHTNSAPETVTRLLDMGLNPLNFSDAFLGVLAQRLVRRLCTECAESYHPTREEFDEIVTEYGGEEKFEDMGIIYDSDMTLFSPKGCQACYGTGYKGRLAIHELMEGTKEIKRMIKAQATTEEVAEAAETQGMKTLKQDGIAKTFQGITDINEVRRVCIN